MEQSERKSGEVRFKWFEPTTVPERLTAEEWDDLEGWLETILGDARDAAQQAAEMRAYVELRLRHQNN